MPAARAAIVIFCDGGTGHIALKGDHLKQLEPLMDKGVGLGLIHYAVEVPKDSEATPWAFIHPAKP